MPQNTVLVDRYNFSFTAKLCQSDDNVKEQYNQIMNKINGYKKISTRMANKHVSVNRGYMKLIRINFTGKKLSLYFAFDPNEQLDSKYRLKDFSHKKLYEVLPMRLKLTSPRSLKYALELIDRIMNQNAVVPRVVENVDYIKDYPYKSTQQLIEENLVKHTLGEPRPFNFKKPE